MPIHMQVLELSRLQQPHNLPTITGNCQPHGRIRPALNIKLVCEFHNAIVHYIIKVLYIKQTVYLKTTYVNWQNE